MPPQAPAALPPNYDFLTNPAPQRRPKLLPTNGSLKQRIIVVVGGGVALIIVIIIFSSLFLGKGTDTSGFVTLAQQQNELIRVATEGSGNAMQQPTKNLILNVELGLTTDQQQLLAYLKKLGQKVSTKELGRTQSSATDQQLTAAQAASTYDTVMVQIMQTELTRYSQTLKQTYGTTKDSAGRQLLNTDYGAATLLLNEANSAAQSLQSS